MGLLSIQRGTVDSLFEDIVVDSRYVLTAVSKSRRHSSRGGRIYREYQSHGRVGIINQCKANMTSSRGRVDHLSADVSALRRRYIASLRTSYTPFWRDATFKICCNTCFLAVTRSCLVVWLVEEAAAGTGVVSKKGSSSTVAFCTNVHFPYTDSYSREHAHAFYETHENLSLRFSPQETASRSHDG